MAPDGECDRAGHAAFAGAAEGAGLEGGDGLVEVGVGHDDQVVFRTAGGLDAFAVLRAGFVDVFCDGGGADEGDGADERMVEEGVNGFLVAVNNIEDACGGFRLRRAGGRESWRRGELFQRA